MAYFTMTTPKGDTLDVFDGDVSKARAKGWKLIGPTDESLPEMQRVSNEGEQRVRGMGGEFARMLPTAAAMGLGMTVGGPAVGAAMLPRLLMAGRAIGMAGAGGAGGEAVRRGVTGETFDVGAMAREGGRQMAFAVPGEGLAQGAGLLAQPISRYAWRMSPTAQKAAGANMTATAREMFPEGEKLWETALRERVPPSPGKIRQKIKPVAEKKGRLEATDVAKGNTYTAKDVIRLSGITEIKRNLAMLKDEGPKAIAELEARVNRFLTNRTVTPKKPGQAVKDRRYNAEELQREIRVWQKENERLYKQIAGGTEPITSDLDRALPRAANKALERNIPELGPVNARLQRLGRLEDQAANVQRSGGTFLPILGGIGGGMIGDDPVERVRNAAGTALAMRGITSPMVQGRAGLALTSPITQRAARELPRWLLPWMFPQDETP